MSRVVLRDKLWQGEKKGISYSDQPPTKLMREKLCLPFTSASEVNSPVSELKKFYKCNRLLAQRPSFTRFVFTSQRVSTAKLGKKSIMSATYSSFEMSGLSWYWYGASESVVTSEKGQFPADLIKYTNYFYILGFPAERIQAPRRPHWWRCPWCWTLSSLKVVRTSQPPASTIQYPPVWLFPNMSCGVFFHEGPCPRPLLHSSDGF